MIKTGQTLRSILSDSGEFHPSKEGANPSVMFKPHERVESVVSSQWVSKMLSMRLKGSAAPHSNWSPTVNAPK